MDNINKTVLPSGIKVISEYLPHVQSFSLGFWFNVGSENETPENNGISHFIEHMLFKGTKKRSPRKIADEIESLGGYLNAFTSKEHTCYYGRGLGRHIKKTFEVLSDMVLESVFKESEIRKEAAVIIDELNDIEDSPEELIFDKFESSIYEGNTIGYPIIGTEENILSFTRNDFLKYYGENYTLQNFSIVASGDVDHNRLVELVLKYFGKIESRNSPGKNEIRLNSGADQYVYKDIQQSHIILGTTTCGYRDKERIIVNLLSHILGEGSSSRLFQSVREKNGIAYQINTFLNSYYSTSTFGVYYSTGDKMVEKALGLILREFDRIKEKPVSDKELKRAKEYLKGSILMGMENTTNRMVRIAQSEIYFNKDKTVEESITEINSVTKEDIFKAANELLDPLKLKKAVISPKNHLLVSVA